MFPHISMWGLMGPGRGNDILPATLFSVQCGQDNYMWPFQSNGKTDQKTLILDISLVPILTKSLQINRVMLLPSKTLTAQPPLEAMA